MYSQNKWLNRYNTRNNLYNEKNNKRKRSNLRNFSQNKKDESFYSFEIKLMIAPQKNNKIQSPYRVDHGWK